MINHEIDKLAFSTHQSEPQTSLMDSARFTKMYVVQIYMQILEDLDQVF